MAAATVTNQRQNNVAGRLVMVLADTITFASDGDTWDTGLNSINAPMMAATTEEDFGFTYSGGIVTLVCSSAPITFRGGFLGNF